ncbi:MAG: MBL fold metallo-hydrolase [Thiomicrorhabdus sp.]|nr:MBL fold metallo-hydrolase [Thiomicrorhabdus sp.]
MALNIAKPSLVLRQLIDRDTWTYTYLLLDPVSLQGVLIDPVQEQLERDLSLIKELGVELLYVLETHVHADHITAAGQIRQKTGAKIVYSEAAEIKAINIAIKDAETLTFGHYTMMALATPGHTNGCVSYLVDNMLFSGDSLLIHGCGRTDFQQGSAEQLYDSITQKLFTLPGETLVYPGHDYSGRTSSTIAEEKRWNHRLGGGKSKQAFIQIMNNLNLDLPKKINEAVPANLETGISFNPKRYLHEEFSMLDLHNAWKKCHGDDLIVDTRSATEFASGHVPGAKNIAFGDEGMHAEELKRHKTVYLYCRSGRRAQTAFTNLSIMGLNNLVCVGHSGMPEWINAGYPGE